VRAGAEAPSGYGKEKEGFEDWVCKAFWRFGLPQPPAPGGGLHRTSGEPPRRETGPAAAAKLASSRCLRMRMHKCGSIAVGMHTTWASIIIRWRDATQSICKEIKSEDSLIKWKML